MIGPKYPEPGPWSLLVCICVCENATGRAVPLPECPNQSSVFGKMKGDSKLVGRGAITGLLGVFLTVHWHHRGCMEFFFYILDILVLYSLWFYSLRLYQDQFCCLFKYLAMQHCTTYKLDWKVKVLWFLPLVESKRYLLKPYNRGFLLKTGPYRSEEHLTTQETWEENVEFSDPINSKKVSWSEKKGGKMSKFHSSACMCETADEV